VSDLAGPLVLSPDVVFVPVGDLPEAVRDQLGEPTGYAVTRPHGRASSTLLDVAAADLLKEFTSPSTIVEAVIRYSRDRNLDPERVLDNAYLALRQCMDSGYLVPPGAQPEQPARPVFATGDRVADGVVQRCLQTLEDGEVYQLIMDDGGLAALKVLGRSRSAAGAGMLRREAKVLRYLDGRVAPRLLACDLDTDAPWLAMEWCDGVPVTTAAAALRRTAGSDAQLLDLCCRVTAAYAQLHGLGILHGDVHPGNVLVSPSGGVRILDFGLARATRPGLGLGDPPRAGAPMYLSPDHAAAVLVGRRAGPATASSEVFCLGALLHELFTGSGYVEFAIDNQEMLRQIVEDPPLPFTRRGRASWPEVEQPLARALAKDPGQRPDSVAEFGRQLAAARPRSQGSAPAGRGPAASVNALLESVLAEVRPGGTWFEDGLPTAPLCSVAYGSAGAAVALQHVAAARDDPELVALADEWALRAAAQAGDLRAFTDPGLELTEEITGRVTPFHRLSGIHAAQALVSHSLDDIGARQQALDGFTAESRQPCDNAELLHGRAGTLLGAAIIHEATAGAQPVDLTALTTLGAETMAGIWSRIDASPAISEDTRYRYLGIAHGWAGILLATLRWSRTAGVPLPSGLDERLDQLAGQAVPAGRGLCWPWTNDGTPSMPGWCNGSAGYVHLWTAAHAALRDDRWVVLAERAAWDAYVAPATPQLCCGLAGQAYALLELHRHTGEQRWLAAAASLAARAATAIAAAKDDGCIPGSLHKGELGIAALAADLERPEMASMPFFGPQS
jgi:eukaryotic-like serine/threonine-protein kinase